MKGDMMSSINPLMSFLVGAAMATVLLLLFMSAGPRRTSLDMMMMSAGYSGNGTATAAPALQKIPTSDETHVLSMVPTEEATKNQQLAELLKNAAMEDNTVIMTSINHAWAVPGSLLDLFLESFHAGEGIEQLLEHLVIVAMDPLSFERCKLVHQHCYFLKTDGMNYSSEQVYMSKDYLEMMWGRNRFQLTILELGYNFLFTDVDILWLRDPLRYISMSAHIAISSDFYIGNPFDLANFPNGGFVYAKSCNKTIEFYKSWHLGKEKFPGKNEQEVFNEVKNEYVQQYQLLIQFLDTAYVSGFCQLGKDLNKLCTLHANCCIGLGAKLHDLKNVLEDWRKYKAQPPGERMAGKVQLRLPGICIH